jgi:hypothetical protein
MDVYVIIFLIMMLSLMGSLLIGFFCKKVPWLLFIVGTVVCLLAIFLVLVKQTTDKASAVGDEQAKYVSSRNHLRYLLSKTILDTCDDKIKGSVILKTNPDKYYGYHSRIVVIGDKIGGSGGKNSPDLYYTGLNLKDSVFMVSLEWYGDRRRDFTIPIIIGRVYLIGDIMFRVLDISRDMIKIEDIPGSVKKK